MGAVPLLNKNLKQIKAIVYRTNINSEFSN